MSNDEFEMRQKLGVIAQMLRMFRDECTAFGFDKEESMQLCCTMLGSAVHNLTEMIDDVFEGDFDA